MQAVKIWASYAMFFVSCSAFAALPQTGMWGVDSEVNGKPGRGIQIDRQGGNTVIASYYGYRDDGSATFYQAVGIMEDGKSFTADLVEYKNGTALGKDAKTGEVSRVIGPVSMEFDTPSSGSILLPGETAKRFSPLIYEDTQARLNNSFRVLRLNETSQNINNLQFSTKSDDITISIGAENYTCKFYGKLVTNGLTFESIASGTCSSGPSISVYSKKFEEITIDEKGTLSMSVSDIDPKNPINIAINGQYFGRCIKALANIDDTTTIPSPCD
ncbi:hypothetical protein [Comamonas odontotermitis]|uniref:hypothetical protein n=1 Tax=Comamonas odontotermitis TaxID=379895 RepID=UPI0037537DD3